MIGVVGIVGRLNGFISIEVHLENHKFQKDIWRTHRATKVYEIKAIIGEVKPKSHRCFQ